MKEKVIIAMSGGVDSSVAAHLLKNQGYETIGITLKLFNNEDANINKDKTCCSLDDVEVARNISYKLGMPHYVLNFSEAFKTDVIDRFVKTYCAGGTPNPCIDCNRFIKFEKLMLRVKQLDFNYLATGHYAVIEYDPNAERYFLKKSTDRTKDQTYVLYSLTQEQLSKTLFPLGALHKKQVREIAAENGFINAGKHDSQDICFVRDGDYSRFIEGYSNGVPPAGDFIDMSGNIIGRHKGIVHYTIGQRKGLGISFARPMYVCKKNISNQTVVLGSESDLYTKSLVAEDINLIACDNIYKPLRLKTKVRYKQEEQWATVEQTGEGTLHIEFDLPQRAIARGQAVVFYDEDIVVGGGTIVDTT